MKSLTLKAKVSWTTRDRFYVGEVKYIRSNGDITIATHCHTPIGLPIVMEIVHMDKLTLITEDYFNWCQIPGNLEMKPRYHAQLGWL